MTIEEWIEKNKKYASNEEEFLQVVSFLKRKFSHKKSINFNYKMALLKMKSKKKQRDSGLVKEEILFPSGFKIVKLIDDQAFNWDGKHMSNCLGRTKDNYNTSFVYSLRNQKDKPFVNFEIYNKELKQIKGYSNNRVNPKYIGYILEFLQKNKISQFSDQVEESLENAGVFCLDNYYKNLMGSFLKFDSIVIDNKEIVNLYNSKILKINSSFIRKVKNGDIPRKFINSLIEIFYKKEPKILEKIMKDKSEKNYSKLIELSFKIEDYSLLEKVKTNFLTYDFIGKLKSFFIKDFDLKNKEFIVKEIILNSIFKNKIDLVKKIKEEFPDLFEKQTKLYRAYVLNQKNIIEFLLNEKNSRDDLYLTFAEACIRADKHMVNSILNKGLSLSNYEQGRVLSLVVMSINKNLDFVRFLIENRIFSNLDKINDQRVKEINFILSENIFGNHKQEILNYLISNGLKKYTFK